MDFSWSADEVALYDAVLGFTRNRLGPMLRQRTDPKAFPRDAWRLCAAQGLLGMSVPTRHGGLGLGHLATARLMEAFGNGCPDTGLVFSAAAHLFAGAMAIADHGSDDLCGRVLPPLCSGDWVAANAITEAEAGSDVFALQTTATLQRDVVVLDGIKSYVTNGPVADVFVVYATQNPKHRHMGVVAMVVPADTPGIRRGAAFDKIGLDTSPICSVHFDGCEVPASNMLGAPGQGAAVFTASMMWERSCLFAAYLGVMERQLDDVVEHAKARRQFRKSIGKFQAVSHRIAQMKVRLESARMLLYRACWLRDRGEASAADVAMSKLAVSEAAVASSLDAIQVFGGIGCVRAAGVESALRDAVPARIFSGTSEIQLDLIARELGL